MGPQNPLLKYLDKIKCMFFCMVPVLFALTLRLRSGLKALVEGFQVLRQAQHERCMKCINNFDQVLISLLKTGHNPCSPKHAERTNYVQKPIPN